MAGASEIKLYLEVSPNSDFSIDDVSLEQFDNGGAGDWEEEAALRIDALRKRNLKLEVVMPDGTDYNQLAIEVTQTRHNFPFGGAVQSSRIADCWDAGDGYHNPVNDAYCSFVQENFNWIVDTYRMKWKAGEPNEGQIETEVQKHSLISFKKDMTVKLSNVQMGWNIITQMKKVTVDSPNISFLSKPDNVQIPDKMLKWAHSVPWYPGIKVRGHALLWSKRGNNPEWVQVGSWEVG